MSKFIMPSDVRAKHVAHEIRGHLAERGIPIKLSKAYEITARIYGFGTWNALRASFGTADITLDDVMLPAEVAAERRVQHVRALADAGIAEPIAVAIVDAVRPTERGLVKAAGALDRIQVVSVSARRPREEVHAEVLARRPDPRVVATLSGLRFLTMHRVVLFLSDYKESPYIEALFQAMELGMSLADLAATLKAVAIECLAEGREGRGGDEAPGRKGTERLWSFHRTGYGNMAREWHRRMAGVLARTPRVTGRHFTGADDAARDMGVNWSTLGPNRVDLAGTVATLERAHREGGTLADLMHVVLDVGMPTGTMPQGSHGGATVMPGRDGFRSCVEDHVAVRNARYPLSSEYGIEEGYAFTQLGSWLRETFDYNPYAPGDIHAARSANGREYEGEDVYVRMANVLHWFDDTEMAFILDVARAASLDAAWRIGSPTGNRFDALHGVFLIPGFTGGVPDPETRLLGAMGDPTIREYADYLSIPVSSLSFERVAVPEPGRSADFEPETLNLGIARRMPWLSSILGHLPSPALSANEAIRMFGACYPDPGRVMHVGEDSLRIAGRAMTEADPLLARQAAEAFWDTAMVDRAWRPVVRRERQASRMALLH